MANTPFRVGHIDHVELFVPDQYEAARWYQQVLGLTILPDYEYWATNGPLMISSDDGTTMLALFQGDPRGQHPTAGHHRVAFRVDGTGFFDFLQHATTVTVYDGHCHPIQELPVVDHDLSWSVYFCDPYGNRYEITTYDYQFVAERNRK